MLPGIPFGALSIIAGSVLPSISPEVPLKIPPTVLSENHLGTSKFSKIASKVSPAIIFGICLNSFSGFDESQRNF